MSTSNKIAVYPGTFDPVTYGHIDIVERASKLFDSIIIAVTKSSSKNLLFTSEERLQMIKESTAKLNNVTAECFDGLLVDYTAKKNADVIIRGLRTVSDFEFEYQMALTNRKIGKNISTIFMMPDEKYSYTSSTLVKEIARFNGDISPFVPENIIPLLLNKIKK